jgi:hypothetical protein
MTTSNPKTVYTASAEETARKNAEKLLDKKFARRISAAGLGFMLMNFWWAQLIVWGLSTYHIHSGLQGPWLILTGAGFAAITIVAIGMMRAVRDIKNVGRS